MDSIRLPRVKNLWIVSDDEDLDEREPSEFEEVFGNIIVVDNLPVVPKGKFFNLEWVLLQIYGQLGVKESGIWMPTDADTQKTLGYGFVEYNTLQEAEVAKEYTHGFKLDRSHVFAVMDMLNGQ